MAAASSEYDKYAPDHHRSYLLPPFLLRNFTDLQAGMIVHSPVLVKNSECESWSGHF